MISYKPLFVTLAKKSMKKSDLRTALNMGPGTIARWQRINILVSKTLTKFAYILIAKLKMLSKSYQTINQKDFDHLG